MVFKTNYCLVHIKNIAECSKGSILQYFRPSLSYYLSLRPLFCPYLSGRLRQVLLCFLSGAQGKLTCWRCRWWLVLVAHSQTLDCGFVLLIISLPRRTSLLLLDLQICWMHPVKILWAATCDFHQCGILTSVDSDEPVQLPFKVRNSKWRSVSSLIFIEYSSD